MLRAWGRLAPGLGSGQSSCWGLPQGVEVLRGLLVALGALQPGGVGTLGIQHAHMPEAAAGFATKVSAAREKRGDKKRRSRRKSLNAAQANGEPAAVAAEAVEPAAAPRAAGSRGDRLQQLQSLPARLLEDDEHPIRDEHISRPAWGVLLRLRGAGHEAYIVGGTVRDILLGKIPKDYDILTSAAPAQVRRLFSRCYTVGRTFPICHVHHGGVMMEVSSFSTNADASLIPHDAAAFLTGRHSRLPAKAPSHTDPALPTWSAARRDNALHRDFTVNALLYEPFSRVVFDYVGGLQDCQHLLLRTIGDPEASFQEDPARILRAVRLAARAGLDMDEATQAAVDSLGPLVASLPQGRLSMELGALLGYGGAARSLELLWHHGLLHLLLPHHALYLKAKRVAHDYRRRRKPELLFELLRAVDSHAHPQRPLDPSVWLALLAAPLVAKECAALMSKAKRRRGRGQVHQASAAPEVAAAVEPLASVDSVAAELWADLQQQQQLLLPRSSHRISRGSWASGGAPAAWAGTAAGGGSGGDEEGQDSQGATACRREYLEAYHQVVRDVLERMLLPLDTSLLRKLGLGEQAEAALREAILGPEPTPAAAAGGKASRPSRRQRLRRRQREEQRAAAALQAAAAAATDGGGWAEALAGVAAAAAGDGAVLVPPALPRGSAGKAVGLLLTEAELRGLPLPLRGAASGGREGKAAAAAGGDGEEAGSSAALLLEGRQQQQQQQHRQHLPHRKLSLEERLVVGVLRDFGWQDLTQLPV